MPHLFSFAANHPNHSNDDTLQEMGLEDLPHKRMRGHSLLKKPFSLLRRHHGEGSDPTSLPATAPTECSDIPEYFPPPRRRPSLPDNVMSKRAVPSLPRPQTFSRQESERREKLLKVQPTPKERRALSADRRRSRGLSASGPHRALSPCPFPILPSISAPEFSETSQVDLAASKQSTRSDAPAKPSRKDLPPLEIPDNNQGSLLDDDDIDGDSAIDKGSLHQEFDRRWILNLSMHFRDKSNREKFFVTYAEKPNQWRRVTISLDYRNAPPDSLEADLSTLHFQRDKSLRIYEAIRESLPEIQYYDTVTNLKLETTQDDNQLHVHVREDANEIVEYPGISLFDHVRCPRFNESSLDFESHMSGFVYKVRLADRIVVKKEIPGPDTVDEFLYEVNALDSLLGCQNVVQLEGLVTDDRGELVKGLLISYASQGALVDMIYDFRNTPELPWYRREKWARQIVGGLADIHEAGFVQGDFTLSNIVIDQDDNAQIIDINRRGCPVGWEPPELSRLVNSGQRIGMCIGVKTDLYQLGMVLWALAEEVDEPERVERPLPPVYEAVPDYFCELVQICLSQRPQERMATKQLLEYFPAQSAECSLSDQQSTEHHHGLFTPDLSGSTVTHRSAKEYIDPQLAVTIEEIQARRKSNPSPSNYDSEQVTYVNPDSNPSSSTYRFESSGSWIIGRRSRGRSPVSSRRRRSSPYGRTVSSATSLSDNSVRCRPRLEDESPSDTGDGKVFGRPAEDASCAVVEDDRTSTPVTRHYLSLQKRVAAVQGQDSGRVAELVHTDSGFDEMMDDLNLDNSHMSGLERPKNYVPDDEPREEEHGRKPVTPNSGHSEYATARVECDDRRRTLSRIEI